jgi:hypothetical protein
VKPAFIDGGKAILELREDGVIHLVWQPRVSLEVADVKAAIAKINEVSDGLARPMLVEMTDIETVSHDARAAFSIPCAASRIALLGSSPVDWGQLPWRPHVPLPHPILHGQNRSHELASSRSSSMTVPAATLPFHILEVDAPSGYAGSTRRNMPVISPSENDRLE